MTATRTRPTAPAPQQPPTARPEEIRALLNTAKTSHRKQTQNLATRILDDIAKLRGYVAEERERREAEVKAAREREEAQAEVARLEQQLAEARAKAGQPFLDCRAPSEEKCGRTFSSRQGRSMHERRAHGYHHNRTTHTGSETPSS